MRSVIICFALMFCVSLLVAPALAVDTTEYVFELLPSGTLYRDYDFLPVRSMAVYEGRLPVGLYNIYFMDGDTVVYSLSDHFLVDFSSELESFPSSSFKSSFFDGPSFEFFVVDAYDSFGVTILGANISDSSVSFPYFTYVKFVPVNDAMLADFLNPGILVQALDGIVCLFPAVLSVVIACAALYKALAFLGKVLRAA